MKLNWMVFMKIIKHGDNTIHLIVEDKFTHLSLLKLRKVDVFILHGRIISNKSKRTSQSWLNNFSHYDKKESSSNTSSL